MHYSQTKRILCLFITLTILWLSSSPVQAESPLQEVQHYLEQYYVDPVDPSILASTDIDAMLTALGDPYTVYYTAEAYQNMQNSINLNFVGIGVYLEQVDAGVRITGVMASSPAQEAGLLAGDIIAEANGTNLAGLGTEEAASYIKGTAGTTVCLLILRQQSSFELVVERRSIQLPAVSWEMLPHQTGYIDINTFSAETSTMLNDYLEESKREGAQRYIFDLRDNGGGYVNIAQQVAGFFIGDQIAINTQYRNQVGSYSAIPIGDPVEKPYVFLINKNSASASEILAGALKDLGKGILIGNRTYGKGCMQTVFALQNGDYLKITIARFTSPLGATIDKTGIQPDLSSEDDVALMTAQLLLSGNGELNQPENLIRVTIADKIYYIDLQQAQDSEFWMDYNKIINSAPSAGLALWQNNAWVVVNNLSSSSPWELYFPSYKLTANLSVEPQHTFHIQLNHTVNWQTVNASSIELIETNSGQRIPVQYSPGDDSQSIKVSPHQILEIGSEYWLVIHPTLQDVDGVSLKNGSLAVIEVKVQ